MTGSRSRTPRRLAAALAGALLGVPLAVPATPVAADDDDPGVLPVRIATFNIRSDRTFEQFKRGIDQLKPRVDVAGLQEIAEAEKNQYLIDDEEWGYYRPPEFRQNPVIWDTSVFDFVSTPTTGYRIALGREVEAKTGGTEIKDHTYATVVRLRHLLTGNVLSIVNVHLLSGSTQRGEPYPGRPRRFQMMVDQVAGLIRLVRSERKLGYEVYPLGDFNVSYVADRRVRRDDLPFKRFRRIEFQSMWEGGELEKEGTFGPVYLDQVWSVREPFQREVARDIEVSDHYPAIATYLLDVELPVPLPVAPALPDVLLP